MGCAGLGRGTIRDGCWSISPSRSPTAPRRSATLRCWLISRRCSGQSPRDSTCWRLLDVLDERQLGVVAGARARAREVAWAQRAEATGRVFARSRVAGTSGIEALVIDLDAHVLVCHSEKEQTAPTFKHTFGYHPLLAT